MKHPEFVEYWRRKNVDSQMWYVNKAKKYGDWRHLQLIREQQEAETLSYRRAYIELGAIAAGVIAVAVWSLS